MDEAIFRWINGWPDSLNPIFWFLSESTKQTWVKVVLALYVLILLIATPKTRRAGIMVLIAWGLANGLTDALKAGFQVTRPCVDLIDCHLRVGKLTSFGTASAHAANMAAVAFVLTAALGRWGWFWIPIAFLVGISRIYVGVHYPSQVLLGWLSGAFAGFLVVMMQRKWTQLGSRRKAEEETINDKR
jgi:undecaprenyl-diphosphatase